MLHRAYSILDIRSVSEDERVIEGVASTPSVDRMGDIVDPMGARFAVPLPLLWQHMADQPVGHVEFAKPTKDGIPFRARIASIPDAGELKDLTDKAWQSVKAKLVRAVSIGFKSLDYEPMKDGGLRFKEWEWLELSLVTIPANAEATISVVRSIDAELRAASGQSEGGDSSKPGASGPVYITHTRAQEGAVMLESRIRDFEATRQAKYARMEAIMEEASKAGRTKDESEQEEWETLRDEVKRIDAELRDLHETKAMAEAAKPVSNETKSEAGTESRGVVRVTARQAMDPGIRFARVVRSLYHSHNKHRDVEQVARQLYPDDALTHKAAVAAGSTTGDTWGDELVSDEGAVFADFVEFLRPLTILGRFGSGGVPSLRRVPFRVPLGSQTEGGDGYWVGEGQPKPLTKFEFARTTIEPLKVANIAVVTKELLKYSSVAADGMLRDKLADALAERLDIDFIDPAKTVDPGVSPASITNGAPSIAAATGGTSDGDDVRLDIRSVFQLYINANNAPTTGVWVMSHTNALALSLMTNALGQPEFPSVTMTGGSFQGLPVITSEYVGDIVVLVKASDIWLADEGGVSVDVSTEASLHMQDDDSVAGDALTGAGVTGVSLVSMFQTNSVAFLAERTINWARRRPSAVAVLSGVAWGGDVNES